MSNISKIIEGCLERNVSKEHMDEIRQVLANNAVTSVSVYAGTMQSLWAKDIIDYARANLVLRPLAMRDENMLMGRGKGTSMYIHKITAPTMTWNTGADDDLNESAKVSSFVTSDVTATPAWAKAGMSIIEEILLETPEDVLASVRNTLAYEMAKKIDDDTLTSLMTFTVGSTAVEATLGNGWISGVGQTQYGGGGSYDPSTMASTDVAAPDNIQEVINLMELDNFHPNAMVLAPPQKRSLMQAPQFSDASKWGNDTPIKTGQIGTYQGMNVFETTQLGTTPTLSGWGAAGRYILLVDTTKAFVHVPALGPNLDYDFTKKDLTHHFYAVMKYKAGVRYQADALGVLACAN